MYMEKMKKMDNNITVSMPIERYTELIDIEDKYNIIMKAAKMIGLGQFLFEKDARLFVNWLKLKQFNDIDTEFNLTRQIVTKENNNAK